MIVCDDSYVAWVWCQLVVSSQVTRVPLFLTDETPGEGIHDHWLLGGSVFRADKESSEKAAPCTAVSPVSRAQSSNIPKQHILGCLTSYPSRTVSEHFL